MVATSTAYKFRDQILMGVPRWLRNTNGYRLLFAIGTQLDAMADAAYSAVTCRFPGLVDMPNTLPYLGRDRRIRKGFYETNANYATRLKTHLDVNRKRGLGLTMLEQIKLVLAPTTFDAWIVHNRGTSATPAEDGIALKLDSAGVFTHYETPWHWDDTDDLSRFWVVISMPAELLELDGYWGDPGDWGDGGYWAVEGDTGPILVTINQIVDDFTPAHMVCESIIVVSEDDIAAFWASPPDGDWDRWANRNPIALYA